MNRFLEEITDFTDFKGKTIKSSVPAMSFDNNQFLATENASVEGLQTGILDAAQQKALDWAKDLIGKSFAFAKDLTAHSLPIIARNHLNNGISDNLWYEEFVPRGSVFYTVIMTPEKECALNFGEPVQIGGNASIGYGFTKIEEIDISSL